LQNAGGDMDERLAGPRLLAHVRYSALIFT
jgi:hypothetical protein